MSADDAMDYSIANSVLDFNLIDHGPAIKILNFFFSPIRQGSHVRRYEELVLNVYKVVGKLNSCFKQKSEGTPGR